MDYVVLTREDMYTIEAGDLIGYRSNLTEHAKWICLFIHATGYSSIEYSMFIEGKLVLEREEDYEIYFRNSTPMYKSKDKGMINESI